MTHDEILTKNMELAGVIRALRANARENAARIERLERERDEAREKIKRQAERIKELEGCTNHACGTPLSVALRERDEAHALLDTASDRIEQLNGLCNLLRDERDILRSNKMSDPLLETTFKHLNRERDEACQVANGLAKQVERLRKQRDEARGALMKIEDRCVDCEDACGDIQKIRDIAAKALEGEK